jgi:hypothetical protein
MRAWIGTTAGALLAMLSVGWTSADATQAASCKLRPETPLRVMSEHDDGVAWSMISHSGAVKCARAVRRGVKVAAMLELQSGKEVSNGVASAMNTKLRAGKRQTLLFSKACFGYVTARAAQDDPPVNVLTRITLYARGDHAPRELKHEDSERVPLTELCPEGT